MSPKRMPLSIPVSVDERNRVGLLTECIKTSFKTENIRTQYIVAFAASE
jgi:hypothetical protein